MGGGGAFLGQGSCRFPRAVSQRGVPAGHNYRFRRRMKPRMSVIDAEPVGRFNDRSLASCGEERR